MLPFFVETRKWWRLTSPRLLDVSSGLSPLIMFSKKNSIPNMFMMDSTGKAQNLYGLLNRLSVAPHAVWGITSLFALYVVGRFVHS